MNFLLREHDEAMDAPRGSRDHATVRVLPVRVTVLLAFGLCAIVRAESLPPSEAALREALFTRTFQGERFGQDELDIFYWSSTRHLLKEPSRSNAIKALDEFIVGHGEKAIEDPFRRALLQRDLWQLFEWAHGRSADRGGDHEAERAALCSRLATAIKRVALSPNQIARLPDNLRSVPRGLLDGKGDWVMLGTSGEEVAASEHVYFFGGHSSFLVLVRLPSGRAETLAYLQKLRKLAPAGDVRALASIPEAQFPAGTVWALVRLMMLVDDAGKVVPTRIVESIQMRRYISVPPANTPRHLMADAQERFEFVLDRAHAPALRALKPDEKGYPFVHFRSQGIDMFEFQPYPPQPYHPTDASVPVLKTCGQCHHQSGIMSIRSYSGFDKRENPANQPTSLEQEVAKTINWQQTRAGWKELVRLWQEAG